MSYLVTLLAGFLLGTFAVAQGDNDKPYVFVQAHRGFSAHYPEQTLLAFERAIEAGADRLEMDLAITSDGHIVMMHDRTIDRTTDGSGPVDAFTLAELQALDAGSWKGTQFAGERIPTLEEVLELADGRAILNLEIKSRGRAGSWVARVIERAVEVVQEHDAADRVVFSSFDFQALLQVRERLPEAKLLLLDWEEPSSRFDMLDIAINHAFYAWSPNDTYATEERIRRAREAGLSVHVGASPGPRALELIAWGVDGLSANNPQALVEFLEAQGYRQGDPPWCQ
jgi:glycerophosphoryl diester phosphodiesterase